MQSGADASVYIVPGTNGGSVFFEGEDILHLIKVMLSDDIHNISNP